MTAPRIVRFAPLLVVFVVGCLKSTDNVGSDKVDESAVHQSLHLTHNAATDSTQVFARFRVGGSGGTNLVLVPPSGVTADGQPMSEQNGSFLSDTLPGRSYARTTPGFRQQAEVKLTARSGKVYANTLRLEKADFPADPPTAWSRTKGVTLPFAGPPLEAGEQITLHFTSDTVPADPKTPSTANATGTQVGVTSVTLSADALAGLPTGGGKAMWTRTRTATLQQGTPTGGELVSTYHSNPLAVKLVD